DERALLTAVKEALDGGARGVAMGRNIWQHEDPRRMVAAVAAVVHGGATVEQALNELR
ncbi:MAG: aldolase, partial [Bacillota bacterium]